MQNNTRLLMQDNTLIRDAQNKDMDNGTAIESGGVELSFGQNIQVLNNTIQTLNAPANEHSDGEAITTQNSNTPDVLDAGSATAITAITLSDANARWGTVTASRLPQYPEIVAILTGSATGQWRAIQGIDIGTKTLTLSQPWSPVPEVGSLYSIFVWTLMNATIQGNTLIDNPNGIVLWDGCYNCTVQNNVLTNSRGILLRTADIPPQNAYLSPNPESRRAHHVAIKIRILNNTLSNTSGVRPVFIALDVEAFAPDSYRGIGMMDIQLGGNTVNPYPANPNQSYNPAENEISQEGFFPCFLFGPAPVKDPITTVFQNINFWNDTQNVVVTYSSSFLPYTSQACVTASAPLGP
jgi:parallel beta-helix repeat protein